MKKKLMLIINPAAGRGGYKQGFTEALKILNDGGYRTTLFYTDGARDATEYAGRYAHPYDVGGFGADEYFAYIAAFGAFTEVSYATPQDMKKRLGHLAYVLQGMAALPKLESYNTRVEYDGGVVEAPLVYGSMSNSTSVAGIVKLREEMVCLGDGMSELVLVKDPGSIEGFSEIVTSVLSQRYDSDKLIILHTTRAKFTFEKPVAWTRDGEAGGKYAEVELKNYAAPIELIF